MDFDHACQVIYQKANDVKPYCTNNEFRLFSKLKQIILDLETAIENNKSKVELMDVANQCLSKKKYEELKTLEFQYTKAHSGEYQCLQTDLRTITSNNFTCEMDYEGDYNFDNNTTWYYCGKDNDGLSLVEGDSVTDQIEKEYPKFNKQFMKTNKLKHLTILDLFALIDPNIREEMNDYYGFDELWKENFQTNKCY